MSVPLLIGSVRADLADLSPSGPRARLATMAALSVGFAVLAAIWLRLDAPWWAGISAFVCTQATQPASFTKAAERVGGTILGACVGFLIAPALSEEPLLILPALLISTTLGIAGGALSRHGYGWLLGGITADMVVLGVLANPALGPFIALARSAETAVGAAAALAVASMLADPGTATAKSPAPGWSTLFGANRHVLGYAVRTGLAVMLVPLVWDWFALPGLDQMAISVAAVMAVPGLVTNPEQVAARMRQRGLHRAAGCVLGGTAGLMVLAAAITSLPPWLAALLIGVWIGAYLQTTARDTGYVGQQATVAFILTVVQGWGPPLSLAPGLERLVGILSGMGLLLIISAAWPAHRPAPVLR